MRSGRISRKMCKIEWQKDRDRHGHMERKTKKRLHVLSMWFEGQFRRMEEVGSTDQAEDVTLGQSHGRPCHGIRESETLRACKCLSGADARLGRLAAEGPEGREGETKRSDRFRLSFELDLFSATETALVVVSTVEIDTSLKKADGRVVRRPC